VRNPATVKNPIKSLVFWIHDPKYDPDQCQNICFSVLQAIEQKSFIEACLQLFDVSGKQTDKLTNQIA